MLASIQHAGVNSIRLRQLRIDVNLVGAASRRIDRLSLGRSSYFAVANIAAVIAVFTDAFLLALNHMRIRNSNTPTKCMC